MKRRAKNPGGLSKSGTGESGFTFVEIMIALTVGAIVIAGMYQGFNILHKWWISAGIRSDMRQNARAGLETLSRDIEMAGYQTTNYGDVNKTGLAITLASTHELEMDQQRLDMTLPNQVYEPRIVYYHLATDMRTNRQNLYRQIRAQPGVPTPDEIVAENVSVFILGYLDKDNRKFKDLGGPDDPGDPDDPADLPNPPYRPGTQYALVGTVPAQYSFGSVPPAVLKNIRRIQVALTTEPARAVPFGPVPKPFTLMASVMPQNLGAADEVVVDTTPPKVPTGLAVVDTGSCSEKLDVSWSANTEPDLAGYLLYYGPTDYVDVPVRALADKLNPRVKLNPRDLLITKYANRDTSPNTYPIQVLAYDASRNRSEKSAVVAGNPKVANTGNPSDYVGGAPDTTVNPRKPSPPAGLTFTPGAAEGELVISWPTAASATAGYRLYRSTAAFADGHIDGSLQIAREATLAADVTTWTDTSLESCRTYYYAVASVNCDETLVADYQYNGTNPALSDYIAASGTPRDTTAPPAPGFAGAQTGEKRVLLALTNPLEAAGPDFDRTEIFWNKSTPPPAAPPHLDGTVVVGGTHIPNSDGGSPGTFETRGSQEIVFDNESAGSPVQPLVEGAAYGFLAVSYDRCGNASAAPPLAVEILGSACSDDPPGPPPAATHGTITACQPDSVVLAWEYPETNTMTDFVRFRIFRAGPDGVAAPLADGPRTLTTWTDTHSPEADAAYTYWVIANDCVYERYMLDNSLPWPYPDPKFAPSTYSPLTDPLPRLPLKLGPVYPGGGLRRYASPPSVPGHFVTTESDTMVSDQPSTYTYHNNVRFWLQNTSRSPFRIKKMAVTWDNPNVVLDKVVIGSGATERTVTVAGAASGVEFEVNTDKSATFFRDVAGSTLEPVPVLLRFMTTTGAINRLTDMRNKTLGIDLWSWNLSFDFADCPNPTRFTIDVPRGPELGFFSQSAPGRDGIDSYAVIGPSRTARDTDIKVSTGVGVNVFGMAVDHSGELFANGVNQGFDPANFGVFTRSSVKADPAAVPSMPAGSHVIRSLATIGGDRYAICPSCLSSSPVAAQLMPHDPSTADKVHWYYALAVDKTGNWDRVPNPDYGNYAYYQTAFDVCSYSYPPEKPVLTSAAATGNEISLTWTPPTAYADAGHTPIVSDDILTYDVYYKKDSGDWALAPNGANRSSLRYDHGDLSTGSTYRYKVQARKSCVSCAPCTLATCTDCMTGPCWSDCTESSGVVVH
ncbi:MAG: prepilin-type N-terminal cleavage/methylation domain-containing protein [Candidatus Methylomirabilia bacterium]